MARIVIVGSCGLDFTTYSSRLPKPGETLIGNKFTTSYGGKGANQCVAAAKLGAQTFMIGKVGDDMWGEKYKNYLQGLGTEVNHLQVTKGITTGIAQISVAENGDNQIIVVSGANGTICADDIDQAKDIIQSADVLIGQLEIPFEATLAAFKLNNKIKIFNAAPAYINIDEILPHCTILCVNEIEATFLSKCDVHDVLSAVKALQILIITGCDTVIITLGPSGAVYLRKSEMDAVHVMCPAVNAVDTTGAGDAFVGALATFLTTQKDYPLHQLIGAACEVASISVTGEGTQTSYPTDYVAFEKEYSYATL